MRTLLVCLTTLVMTVLLAPVVIVAALFRVAQGPRSISHLGVDQRESLAWSVVAAGHLPARTTRTSGSPSHSR